jgi:hypothetical protein
MVSFSWLFGIPIETTSLQDRPSTLSLLCMKSIQVTKRLRIRFFLVSSSTCTATRSVLRCGAKSGAL